MNRWTCGVCGTVHLSPRQMVPVPEDPQQRMVPECSHCRETLGVIRALKAQLELGEQDASTRTDPTA